LGQAPFEPNLPDILTDQNPHIHAPQISGSHQISLSTPICSGKRSVSQRPATFFGRAGRE
jgi:hypothetical protein